MTDVNKTVRRTATAPATSRSSTREKADDEWQGNDVMLRADLEDETSHISSVGTEEGVRSDMLHSFVLSRSKMTTPPHSSEALVIARDYAHALDDMHNEGIVHGDVSAKSLGVYRERGSRRARGHVRDLKHAHVAGSVRWLYPDVGDDVGMAENIVYKAPETVTTNAEPGGEHHFVQTHKGDVWSLGIAMMHLLTGKNVYHHPDGEDAVSDIARVRASSLYPMVLDEDTTKSHHMYIEAVKWQRFKLFGGDAFTRRLHIGHGLREVSGCAGDSPLLDLLTCMLDTNPCARCDMAHVSEALTRIISPFAPVQIYEAPPPESHIDTWAPRGGWTDAKDAAVVDAVVNAMDQKCTHHRNMASADNVPIDAYYLVFDMAARVAAGFDAPEPRAELREATAAAARLALGLYGLRMEESTSRLSCTAAFRMEKEVVRYLDGECGGNFRRARTAALLEIINERDVACALSFMVRENCPKARAFRGTYLAARPQEQAAQLRKLCRTKFVSLLKPVASADMCTDPTAAASACPVSKWCRPQK